MHTMGGRAQFAGIRASGAAEVRHDVAALDEPGFWVVVDTFEGELTAVRMQQVSRMQEPVAAGVVEPLVADPDLAAWSSSLDRSAYERGVRDLLVAGELHQASLCRVLSRAVPPGFAMDELDQLVRHADPAPRAAYIDVPDARLEIVCASPGLYLKRAGEQVWSSPITGSAATSDQLRTADRAENVVITDLVRTDLSAVCRPGT